MLPVLFVVIMVRAPRHHPNRRPCIIQVRTYIMRCKVRKRLSSRFRLFFNFVFGFRFFGYYFPIAITFLHSTRRTLFAKHTTEDRSRSQLSQNSNETTNKETTCVLEKHAIFLLYQALCDCSYREPYI